MFLITWLAISLLHCIPIEAFRDGDVRLVNSNRYGTGRVEVFHEGNWGTICHRGWDLEDSEVICRQLGFPNGAQRFFPGARFGEGNGRVLLADVNCVGNETNLLECNNVRGNWASSDCQHGSDVGVQCNAPNFEGCFRNGLLRAIDGFTVEDMTLEKCFSFCATGGYQYTWLHLGIACDCGNEIDASEQVDNDECTTLCPGNSDQICGGVGDKASVYKVGVDLPYVASPGFPGQYTSTGGALILRNFVPQGVTGYSYIRFHQFGLPSDATLLVSSMDRTETIQGDSRVSEYWISSDNIPIQISFQPPQQNIESLGFLLEFGEGMYCPDVTSVSNGRLSTTASVPYTVGAQIRVICNPGFMAYDDEVFCQADGRFNRDIRCDPSGSSTVPSSTTITTTITQTQPAVATNVQVPTKRQLSPNVTIQASTQQIQQTRSEEQSQPLMTMSNVPSTSSPDNISLAVLSVVSILSLITAVFLLAYIVWIWKRRTLPSKGHTDGTCVNEGVASSISVSSQHSLGHDIPPDVTLDGYQRHIVNTDNTGKQNGYYYMENDPNNHANSDYDSKLHQDYSYEHVQL